jgi:hypothetical protein
MQITDRFGPIPVSVVLDGNGDGSVTFQPNGKNARITTLFVKVDTATLQATVTIYKGQIADSNIIGNTNSGSTGAPAFGNIDMTDGETLFVVWRGGDAGATASATFTGKAIPFSEIGDTNIRWDDPIAAGDGSLIFPAIKSPNYVQGVTGWYIGRTGDAEFNDVTVRGEVDVNGNDNSSIRIFNNGGQPTILLQPDDFTDPAVDAANPAIILAVSEDNALASSASLFLQSPEFSGPGYEAAFIDLEGENWDHSVGARIGMSGTVIMTGALEVLGQAEFNGLTSFLAAVDAVSLIVVNALDVGSGTDNITLNGRDIGNGWISGDSIAASNPGVTTATEVIQLTAQDSAGNSALYRANRVWKVTVSGNAITTSTAAAQPLWRLRKTNTAGQVLDVWRTSCSSNGAGYSCSYTTFFRTGANAVTADLVLTLAGVVGQTITMSAGATGPGAINVEDVTDQSGNLATASLATLI